MAKSKQKDFAKVKLKVGRKLKPANSTSTEFKTKKVVVRGAQSTSDPVRCLIAAGSTSIRIMHLTKLLDSPLLSSSSRITGDLLNALARLAVDPDEKVRKQARLCIERSLNCMAKSIQSMDHSVSILLTHVKCGLTNLNPAVANESRKLMSFLVAKSSPALENRFLEIVRTRFWDRKQISLLDMELIAEIVTKFHCASAADGQQPVVVKWSSSNNHIPWSALHKSQLSHSVDVTFCAASSTDIRKEMGDLLRKITFEGLSEFSKRSGDTVSLNLEQGRRLLALLKLSRSLNDQAVRGLILPEYEVVSDLSKKKATLNLNRQIRELLILK